MNVFQCCYSTGMLEVKPEACEICNRFTSVLSLEACLGPA